MSNFNGFVIVDIETTGLDPDIDQILELGILVADKNFNVLGEFGGVAYFDLELQRPGISEFVIDMHTKNGLWDECKASHTSLAGLQVDAIHFLEGGEWTGQPMCGSTIQFDRSFIAAYMPKLNEKFHYRHIDVSSFKNIWAKYEWPQYNTEYTPGETHRSLPDCRDTLDELKRYVLQAENWLQMIDNMIAEEKERDERADGVW